MWRQSGYEWRLVSARDKGHALGNDPAVRLLAKAMDLRVKPAGDAVRRWQSGTKAMTDLAEIILRLVAATLIGAAIGLNRDLRGKPIGVRTLGLVGLASAVAVLAVAPDRAGADFNPASRVIQGVLTGIGFLGAGVIVRREIGKEIHGLTSAACAWATACLGLVCGLAAWPIVATGVALVFALLIFGGPFERISHRRLSALFGGTDEDGPAAHGDAPAGREPAGRIDPPS
jgi:putative Mg2+ transporter-C (MgtC) family protein